MSDVAPLTLASRSTVPPCCADCVFWQSLRALTDGRRKERWGRALESEFGPYGRVLHEGERFRGLLQYGPAAAFPRARALPAGPPDPRAALITCAWVEGDDPVGSCERLLLEALADLKARGFGAVEAFALRHPDDVPPSERTAGSHTLFDRTLLARLGFSPVRSQGQVALMRLPLGGLAESPAQSAPARARSVLSRLAAAAGRPAPA